MAHLDHFTAPGRLSVPGGPFVGRVHEWAAAHPDDDGRPMNLHAALAVLLDLALTAEGFPAT